MSSTNNDPSKNSESNESNNSSSSKEDRQFVEKMLKEDMDDFLSKLTIDDSKLKKLSEAERNFLEKRKDEFDAKMENLRKRNSARSMIEMEAQEEKLKDLDEGWKKRSDIIDPSLKSSPIDIKDEQYPDIYKVLDRSHHYFNTDINIGQKWGSHLKSSAVARINYERSGKRGTFLYESAKRGKLGYDLYLLIFGLIGAFAIPVWLYRKMKPQFDFVQKDLGITPATLPELDDYDSYVDLDEISEQKSYYNLFTKEINLEKWKNFQKQKEIRELEEELYGQEPDQFDESDDLTYK
jgi:hypothetical protein